MKYFFSSLLITIISHVSIGQERTDQTHLIYSESISENRQITVSLPEHYDKSTERYGVLYVLDGEYTFEFAKGATHFLSNAFGHMPPLLVVSIPNIDRTRDMYVTYNEADGYVKFLNFIEKELMAFINETYRTNGFDILYGWSSASNINFQFLASKPNLFDAHIQSGTGVGNKTSSFLNDKISVNTYRNVYLYASTEGGSRAKGLKRYESLIYNIHPQGVRSKFEIMDSSSHVGVIADGIYRGLRFVFNDFYIPDSIARESSDSIIEYYGALADRYNFELKIPTGAIGESAGILFQNNRAQEAIKILEYGIELYPWSADLAGSLAEIYEYLKQNDNAVRYYQVAFKRSVPNSALALKYKFLSEKLTAGNKEGLKE